MKNNFIIHVIGKLSQLALNELHAKFTSKDITTQIVTIDDTQDNIAEAYRKAIEGHMLIISGLPYHAPFFGSLSRRLFGPIKDNQGNEDYIKTIYIIPNTDDERKAWQSQMEFLPKMIGWNQTQVKFPNADLLLKNLHIIDNIDDINVPNKETINQLVQNIKIIPSRTYQPDEIQKIADIAKMDAHETAIKNIFVEGIDHIQLQGLKGTVISAASELKTNDSSQCRELFKKIGALFAKYNITQIYGACGKPSIMRDFAEATWTNKGKVDGIVSLFEYERFEQRKGAKDWALSNLQNLILTKDIASRTELLINSAKFLVVGPGGTGTVDELALFVTNPANANKPIFLINVEGHLDHLCEFLNKLTLSNPQYVIKSEKDLIDNFEIPLKRLAQTFSLTTSFSKPSMLTHFKPEFNSQSVEEKVDLDNTLKF